MNSTLEHLKKICVVAIIRSDGKADVVKSAGALIKGGIRALEVTMNTPGATDHIATLRKNNTEEVLIGAGTVTSVEMIKKCVDAGAQFIVTPYSRQNIIEEAHKHGLPIFSGAFTPSEIAQAYEWGADVVKVFPAEAFGPAYIKAVKAALHDIPLMPTGGITIDNAGEWFKAGATMLGVGSALFSPALAESGNFGRMTSNAAKMVEIVRFFQNPPKP